METTQEEFSDNQEAVFDWKKNGFDIKEHLSRKVDPKKAEQYNARKKKTPKPENLSLGLKKLRKKIREVYDEDDDENDTIFAPLPFLQEENMLLNALSEDEKRLFYQKDTLEKATMQQSAGKMEALHIANNFAREAGLNNISRKALELGMQEAVFHPEEMQKKVIKKEVSKKLGIKGNIQDGKIIQAARGLKKIKNIGGTQAAKNLDMRDVIKAGEEKLDEIKLAELILEKSGQDIKKRKEKLAAGKKNMQLKHLEQSENHQPDKKPPAKKIKNNFSR